MEQHGWRQPIRYLVVSLVFVVIVWFVIIAQPLINSLIVAALLAYVLHPLVNLVVRHLQLSHNLAVNIIYLLFLSVMVAIPAILTPFGIRQVSGITLNVEEMMHQIRTFIDQPLQFGNFTIPLENTFSSFEELLTQTTRFIASTAVSTLGDISTNFLWILVILVSIYYLLKDSHQLINWILGLVSSPYQEHARKLLAEIDDIWGKFLRGQLLLMLIVGLLSWLGGLAVGLPGAFVIGLVAGILDLIPSLGPTLAALIAIIIAFIEGSSYLPISNFLFGMVILLIFLIIQQLENIWIRPALMGRRLRLHPAVIFVGVFSSLALFGILAALIVIPVMSSISILTRYIHCRIRGIDPYPELALVNTEVEGAQVTDNLAAKEGPLIAGETPTLIEKVPN